MTENRIKLRLDPELTPVRMDDRLDLHAEIRVKVDSRVTPLGIVGLVCIALGTLLLLFGAFLFAYAWPDVWNGSEGYTVSRQMIETVVLLIGTGMTLLFFGTSAFFYGRTVLGSGSLDAFQMQESLEAPQ